MQRGLEVQQRHGDVHNGNPLPLVGGTHEGEDSSEAADHFDPVLQLSQQI